MGACGGAEDVEVAAAFGEGFAEEAAGGGDALFGLAEVLFAALGGIAEVDSHGAGGGAIAGFDVGQEGFRVGGWDGRAALGVGGAPVAELFAGEGGVGIDFLGVPEGDGAGEVCPEGRAGLEGAVAEFDGVLAGEEAADAVVAVFDGGDSGPEGRPGTHFAEVVGAFDDAPVLDETAEEREVPGGGVALEETGFGAIDGQDDGWGRHGPIVPFGVGSFSAIQVFGVLRNMSDKPDMRLTLLLILGAVGAFSQTVPNIRETSIRANTPTGKPRLSPGGPSPNGDMKRIVLNAPGAVCNDGTPAFMYVRAGAGGR